MKTGAKPFFKSVKDFFKKKVKDIKKWNKKRKNKKRRRKQLKKNAKQGKEFENQEFSKFSKKYDNAEEQITIKTKDGTKVRVDAIGKDKETGKIIIQEYKSSPTAPLTPNQKVGFPQLETGGGTIVGKGKGEFYGGVEIPSGTKVEIVRPPK